MKAASSQQLNKTSRFLSSYIPFVARFVYILGLRDSGEEKL